MKNTASIEFTTPKVILNGPSTRILQPFEYYLFLRTYVGTTAVLVIRFLYLSFLLLPKCMIMVCFGVLCLCVCVSEIFIPMR